MATATNITFLTVALYLLDLMIKVMRRPLPKRYLDNVMRLTSALQ